MHSAKTTYNIFKQTNFSQNKCGQSQIVKVYKGKPQNNIGALCNQQHSKLRNTPHGLQMNIYRRFKKSRLKQHM
jgi:hypothetical protein